MLAFMLLVCLHLPIWSDRDVPSAAPAALSLDQTKWHQAEFGWAPAAPRKSRREAAAQWLTQVLQDAANAGS